MTTASVLRSIGASIRGLIEEFLKKRPQLHVALAWWSPETDGCGPVKVFDGQHKAAAQIMLGVRELPVCIFVEPDTDVLLRAATQRWFHATAGCLRRGGVGTLRKQPLR